MNVSIRGERVVTQFERITIRARKTGACRICGKPCGRTITFEQTLNPWNRKDGALKTREDIIEELKARAAEWKATTVAHASCEAAERRKSRPW